jgi:hypothetical protein
MTERLVGVPNRAIAVTVKPRRFFLPFDEPQRLIGHRKTLVDIVRVNRARDSNNRSRRRGDLAESSVCGFLPHDRENSLRLSAIALCHTR